ncbi:autotransporter outer membrane beta-barrel domain-containing protein [uncultured Hydrogenophaga sp.]|uniref:autotransporter family protein n=1 Tax=uncultured Hydrogenophaga sp. TaxID=199683 RepID=UPI00258B6966|nr:autotransporter outer membrane beta-barrel domain-containing protein [uncultured Hydrogenophaga sp.]
MNRSYKLVALAMVGGVALVPIASATDYPVSDTSDLLNAIPVANGDGDPNTSFTLGQNITTPAGTVFGVVTNPVTLDIYTSGFTLNLNGAGTVWDMGSFNYVGMNGVAGTNALSLTNGATARVRGFVNWMEGGLLIENSGSGLSVDGDFAVGRNGDSSITLTSGGTLTTGRAFIGEDAVNTLANTIDVLVDGAGTVWTVQDYFGAGGAANGVDITVSNGAVVQSLNGSGSIGRNGTASMLVTGSGSRFIVPFSLHIGEFGSTQGNGTLTVRDGGLVSAELVDLGMGDVGATGALVVDTGGVIEAGWLGRDMGNATAHFDNGTLRALAHSTPGTPLIFGFTPGTFTLGAGGLFLDSNGFDVIAGSEMSGIGGLSKLGAGTLTLATANVYGGTTATLQGTLRAGIANAFSAASAHTVAAGATLDTAGLDQTVASLDNAGTVSLLGAAPGSRLTVNGAYVGHNAVLRIGTALGNSASLSDRLVLDGAAASASGTTTVEVTNLGGLGALTTGDGIEVISAINGATTTAQTTRDAFRLAGDHVDAGAYEYRLYAADANGAGENWFLRSSALVAGLGTPAYRVEVPLFAALPEQLRLGNAVMLGNWHQRVGDGAISGAERQTWARLISAERTVSQRGDASPRSEGRLNGLQAGIDLWAQPRWRAGLYVGQLDGDMKVRGFASGIADQAVGGNDLRSQYLGVYATYQHPNGLYVDTVLQGGRHRYSVSPQTALSSHGKGDSLLASVEVGRGFTLAQGWVLEPQLQLMHQRIDLDGVNIAGADVRQDSHGGWAVRAGLRVTGELSSAAGLLQPYGRVNLYSGSKGWDVTRFTGPAGFADVATGTGGVSTELAAGATLALSARTSLYGELGSVWASSGPARHQGGLNASVGLRVRW